MRILAPALVLIFLAACAAPVGEPAQRPVRIAEFSVETADGVTLYYRVAGDGEEVVIAPFALYHGDVFDRLAAGRRVVTYDPRGRGRSQASPLDRVTLDFLLADLDTIRTAVGAEQVAVIGWSGAGMETFVYALSNPGRVTRLVQLAPVSARFNPYGLAFLDNLSSRIDADALAELDARIAAGEFENDEAALCREEARILNPASVADPLNNLPETPDVCIYENEHPSRLRDYFSALFATLASYDWRGARDVVAVPRLVVHGAQDNTPYDGSAEWVAGAPNARILVVEGAGHWPHYERREAVLSAIETFLQGGWPPGAVALPADARDPS